MQFTALLAGPGIAWGLIGPRERDRIWQRHVLNCAVLAELLPPGARVVDVGSGAGLPGLPVACARADLRVDLVEPLERRVRFLDLAVAELGLQEQVRVVRGRVETKPVQDLVGATAWCTARAVAPLDRLVRWCLPLLVPGGRLLAMKGRTAEQELATAAALLPRLGVGAEIRQVGSVELDEPTRVVLITRQ